MAERQGLAISSILVLFLFPVVFLVSEPARVVVVHSYGSDFQWTRDLAAGLRDLLQADPYDYAVVVNEYLDTKRHTDPAYLSAQAAFLAEKHRPRPPDVVVATDNRALEFVRTYRDGMFGPVPTVFAGINDFHPELIQGLSHVTGVEESVSIRETLQAALDLFPNGRLVVLGDDTLTFRRTRAMLERALHHLSPVPEMTMYPAVRLHELEGIAAGLRPGDIVFLASSVLEVDGTVADFWRAGAIVSETMPVPVFVLWDFFIGTGVAGGYVASGREQGRAAARIVRRLLSGVPPDDIPVQTISPNRWVFDMTPLLAAGVSVSDLPAGSHVVNQPPALWREYQEEIVLMLVLLIVMAALIALLGVNVRRRAFVERRLRESLDEKEVLLREIHHRVKNNLQVISSMLSIQGSLITDQRSYAYFRDCETRVQSMALVHEQLFQDESVAHVRLSAYIGELVSRLYGFARNATGRITVEQDVADVSLHLDQAIPVALIVTELLSNALRYAYPMEADGRVHVSISRHDEHVVLMVRDWGVGMDVDHIPRSSLGLQLVAALAEQLHGSFVMDRMDPGVAVRCEFPLEKAS